MAGHSLSAGDSCVVCGGDNATENVTQPDDSTEWWCEWCLKCVAADQPQTRLHTGPYETSALDASISTTDTLTTKEEVDMRDSPERRAALGPYESPSFDLEDLFEARRRIWANAPCPFDLLGYGPCGVCPCCVPSNTGIGDEVTVVRCQREEEK